MECSQGFWRYSNKQMKAVQITAISGVILRNNDDSVVTQK